MVELLSLFVRLGQHRAIQSPLTTNTTSAFTQRKIIGQVPSSQAITSIQLFQLLLLSFTTFFPIYIIISPVDPTPQS
jgi:hypothetical protein